MSSRCGGSSSRKRPRTGVPLISTTNRPPGSASSRAYSPIQETIASGLVKYSYTRSGGASMCTQAVIASVGIGGLRNLISGFHGMLEPLQVLGPELGEEVTQRGEPFGPHSIQALLAVRVHGDQAGVPEHLQVQGDGLLGDVELLGDVVDRPGLVAHQPQDRPSAWVRKGMEDRLAHGTQYSKTQELTCTSHD